MIRSYISRGILLSCNVVTRSGQLIFYKHKNVFEYDVVEMPFDALAPPPASFILLVMVAVCW
uniref:Uncharacterized protein n=1 Tax=Lymantria dispar multicapsid nuclear polyhedrosis virus TaxID=10449 RepID=A0A1B1MQU0_NPVLD|nr:hypothetical protein [Lymantria dispar multiple nucleopolyhedrovirus]